LEPPTNYSISGDIEQFQKAFSVTIHKATMSQFRSKKLDIGGFINGRIIRDHTKRKVFEQYEPDRYGTPI
jgi:hypothetical protein